jgi:hypothetical protein
MKVRVIVKSSNKAIVPTTLDANISPSETAFAFQERIATIANVLCFPDQQLVFQSKSLAPNARLADIGVKNGDVFELMYDASEKIIVKQLSELLGTKCLHPEELSLLYVHRHFVTLSDALKAVDQGYKLHEFLASQKAFLLKDGLVSVVSAAETMQPAATRCANDQIEVTVAIDVQVVGKGTNFTALDSDEENDLSCIRLNSCETVCKAMEVIAAVQQMPFPTRDLILSGKKLEPNSSLHDAGVQNGAHLVMKVVASEASLSQQLVCVLEERTALSPSELGLHYCQRFGTPVCQALRTLGLHSNLRRFLESQPQFTTVGGCVTLSSAPKIAASLLKIQEE